MTDNVHRVNVKHSPLVRARLSKEFSVLEWPDTYHATQSPKHAALGEVKWNPSGLVKPKASDAVAKPRVTVRGFHLAEALQVWAALQISISPL